MKRENLSYFQTINPILNAEKEKIRMHEVIRAPNLPNEIRRKYPLVDQTYKEMVDMSNQKYLSSYRKVPPPYEADDPKKTLRIGKSPGWPGSDCKYVSSTNIRNLEKRAKISIEDEGDQRLLKLNPKKDPPKPKEPFKYSNKPMCTRGDFAISGRVNAFGVGPYVVGVPNQNKDLTNTAYFEKRAIAKECRKQAWTEKLCAEKFKEEEKDPSHQQYGNKVDDEWTEVAHNPVSKSKDDPGKVLSKPTDPSLWSVDLMRKEDKYSGLISSSIPVEQQKQVLFEKMNKRRMATAAQHRIYEQERIKFLITGDPSSFMYTPPIKVPPTKVWNAIENNNDEKTNLLHSDYKTIAHKRFLLAHKEPVPDLRDWIKKYKKEYVLDYHVSCFR